MSWVERLRAQYPVAQRITYLDAAYDLGGALFMRRAAEKFFDEWVEAAICMERGGPGRERFFRMQDAVREDIAELLKVQPKGVCFTTNTGQGINLVFHGFRFCPGDNVVVYSGDFPSIIGPAVRAAELKGLEVRMVDPPGPLCSAEDIWQMVDERTRMVAVSHVQSATGYRIDLGRLGALCRKNGSFLVVDATQSFGLTELDAGAWNVDAVSAAAYKGAQGGMSEGFLYCSPALLRQVDPVFVSYGKYVNAVKTDGRWKTIVTGRDEASKLEAGTVDALGVAVLGSGLRVIKSIGVRAIEAHIAPLYEMLYDGLVGLGYVPVTPRDKRYRSSILSLDIAGDKNALYKHFQASGVALSCSKYLRFGIPPFALPKDIDAALEAAGNTEVR